MTADGTVPGQGRAAEERAAAEARAVEQVTAALLALDLVAAARVTVEPDRRGRRRPVAQVVLAPQAVEESRGSTAAAADLIHDWQDVYEWTYTRSDRLIAADLNLSGWHDSYTGEPLEQRQMLEWIDNTVDLVGGTGPSRVLEIGCGTGLLLFRLAPRTEWYLGLDLSATAISYLGERLGPATGRVRLMQASAQDIGAPGFTGRCAAALHGLPAPHRPDTVLMNSVTQCFPSAAYLTDVLDAAVALLGPGGTIVVGDVRNLALQGAFATSLERAAGPDPAGAEQDRRVAERIRTERELLVDPAFFSVWANGRPRPVRVSVRPKLGTAENELNRFRYDVVLTVEPTVARTCGTVSWQWHGTDGLADLRATVRSATALGRAVRVTGIPNRLVRPFTAPHPSGAGVTPAELAEALAGLPAQVCLSPTGRTEGDLAVVAAPRGLHCELWDEPPADPARLANEPLTAYLERKAPQLLRQRLTDRLPAGLLPGRITVVPAL
ncbi:class I SAM-dependent methyltransferase [Streptomyces clavuligerus]|uniref:Putative non-ribosomal synthetase n=1 Tax=Streptomyces clavuligerus TaxID=1901 RepID=D5SLW5_STRCL|nr:class I SAM-dependent methyltransferase [Streptomyces clavuligerus]EFG04908.1 Putative non-ribosomal synthetase [Streptomyces clavuligerus]MBY6306653.1 class I SAM-dependent methyltransferase [Streptomyces clavuligerus]QCS10740.1 class I SAM-dependent methyltransferase [Streptomyces clavuligerus]QPJ97224.1 methyltransferase [Streptomyces clavuligerus]WDN57453.1 methyltransferase [Streptomyces clavuligerus]